MARGQNDFQARLAKIEQKREKTRSPELEQLRSASLEPPRASPILRIGSPILGIAILTGFVAWIWPDIEPMFVAGNDPLRQGSYLERQLLDNMTDEEIHRMNSDPKLSGKSQMERLILSH
jgi:hypothetical protein